jgi:hypothetical protein
MNRTKQLTLYEWLDDFTELRNNVFLDVASHTNAEYYAVIREGYIYPDKQMYGQQDIMAKTVYVTVYHNKTDVTNYRRKQLLMIFAERIKKAVHFVNVDLDGLTPLISIERSSGQSGGFMGSDGGLMTTVVFKVKIYEG